MIDKEQAVALAKEAGFKYFASWALGDDPKIIRLQRLCNLAVAHEARDLALVQNLLKEYGLQALDVVEAFKAQNGAEPVGHFYKDRYGYLQQADEELEGQTVPLFTHPAHDDTALLRQALEALESLFGIPAQHTGVGGGGVAVWRLGGSAAPTAAITALRERLGDKA